MGRDIVETGFCGWEWFGVDATGFTRIGMMFGFVWDRCYQFLCRFRSEKENWLLVRLGLKQWLVWLRELGTIGVLE